jgi:hypothetical protein
MYDMKKKKIHQLIDGLHLVLVVDVHGGVDDEKKSWKSSFAVRKMLPIGGCTKKFQEYSSTITTHKNTPSLGSLNR